MNLAILPRINVKTSPAFRLTGVDKAKGKTRRTAFGNKVLNRYFCLKIKQVYFPVYSVILQTYDLPYSQR